MEKIDILLATFNGERYIEPQLLSIISQSFKDWHLLIHDDGSNDLTVDIIKKWIKIDSRIELLEDGIKCGGPAANFLHLLKYVEADFIMFCDQDDIWFDNKIEIMYDFIKNRNNELPQVVYSNAYVWKPKEGIKGNATLTFPKNLESFLFLNSGMQGCVAIFNAATKRILMKWQGECAMHDHLLHLVGLTMGNVTYLHLPLMLYRNHNNNVTGGTDVSIINTNKLLRNRMKPVVSCKHYWVIQSFFGQYIQYLNNRDIEIIQSYLLLPSKNICSKLFLVFKMRFKIYNSSFMLLCKILIRPYLS